MQPEHLTYVLKPASTPAVRRSLLQRLRNKQPRKRWADSGLQAEKIPFVFNRLKFAP